MADAFDASVRRQLKEILDGRQWFVITEDINNREATFEGDVMLLGTWSPDVACELLPVEAWLDSEALHSGDH